MGRSAMGRTIGIGVVLVAAIGAFSVVRAGGAAAEPTPAPVPTVTTGRVCIAAKPWLASCDGIPTNPSVTAEDELAVYIQSPIYEDLTIHLTVSRVAGSSVTVVSEFDIQAIPNQFGVPNILEPAKRYDRSLTPGETVSYQLDAMAHGRHVGQTRFTVVGTR